MSNTNPIPSDKYSIAVSTAIAGQMLGQQIIYLDGGSGGDGFFRGMSGPQYRDAYALLGRFHAGSGSSRQ